MVEKLLKQMISIVDDTMESYKSDFYTYDLRSLVGLEDKTPFFWLCDKSHTALAIMSPEYWMKQIKEEAFRFRFMADKENAIGSLCYWLKNSKTKAYYYDGEQLIDGITIHHFHDIWNPISYQLTEQIKKDYPDELKYYNARQEICFSSPEIRHKFMEVLRSSSNPESLLNAVRSKRDYVRCAVNERVVICYEYGPKDFGFYQERNGDIVFNGGIIYSEAKGDTPEHWSSHT